MTDLAQSDILAPEQNAEEDRREIESVIDNLSTMFRQEFTSWQIEPDDIILWIRDAKLNDSESLKLLRALHRIDIEWFRSDWLIDWLTRMFIAIGRVGNTDTQRKILEYLEDNAWQIRAVSARVLGEIGEQSKIKELAINSLDKTIANDPYDDVKKEAAASLKRLNPNFITKQLEDIRSGGSESQIRALEKLANSWFVDHEIATTIYKIVADPKASTLVREKALKAYRALGGSYTRERDLVGLIDDKTLSIRKLAIQYLGDQPSDEAINKLKDIFIQNEHNPQIREAATSALGNAGTADAVKFIIEKWHATEAEYLHDELMWLASEPPHRDLDKPLLQRLTDEKDELKLRGKVIDLLEKVLQAKPTEGGNEEELKRKKDEIIRGLGQRLLSDKEIGENKEKIARILGNTDSGEAKEILVDAILQTEQERLKEHDRAERLKEYYLEPTRKRGEIADGLLNAAVAQATSGFKIITWLNILLFALGLVMIGIGFFSSRGTNNVAEFMIGGGIFSALGVIGVISSFLTNPLDRIQNAVANLVQVETAFLGYIWQLNLNSTYIQSRYVTTGELLDADITNTLQKIEGAMFKTMGLVSEFTEEDSLMLGVHIHGLSPYAVKAGGNVYINGQNFRRGRLPGRPPANSFVALDHQPIKADAIQSWSGNKVEFSAPDSVGGKTVWVTIFVDGKESNAVPLIVEKVE